ncbi:MAG: hypothetical protein JWR63_4155 [Conexibacter sp.]|nr:hypothetical protein [Conexibacter sp.]
MAKTLDPPPPPFPDLDWSVPDRTENLRAVRDYAFGFAVEAERWYVRRHGKKRAFGRLLRVGAVVLGIVAVLVPIVAQMWSGMPPAVAALAIALAAGLVSLDHFYGFSTGWMRFIKAEQRIEALRVEFQFAWEAQRLEGDGPPTPEQVAAALLLAHALVARVQEIVAAETDAWIEEFNSGLARIEETLEGGEGERAA